ncbi:MAG TPA: hypothetical protein VEK35_02500 [Roseiarcus sp.]|nr:hypothetical protein [Roseiarcus sp.]
MISASGKPRAVTVSVDGVPVTTFNETAHSFKIGEANYAIKRRGLFAPDMELWRGEEPIISVHKEALRNRSSFSYLGQTFRLNAAGITARAFALYLGDKQVGSIAPKQMMAFKEIAVDLPSEFPLEIQVFLIWLVVRSWSDNS